MMMPRISRAVDQGLTRVSKFGLLYGDTVHGISIDSAGGARAQILTLGGIIRELVIPLRNGKPQDVVLGYDSLQGYERDTSYLGAVVGRYANRIANGSYTYANATFKLDKNENDSVMLHGGRTGFSKRVWQITEVKSSSVTLRLLSPDGDQGFPGALTAQCRYHFSDDNELSIEFWATADRTTPVNLSQHSYFNLDGSPDISHHTLQIVADEYTPLGNNLIPTGVIAPVQSTVFDFRTEANLKYVAQNFDCNFVLTRIPHHKTERKAAFLRSTLSGLTMLVTTTKPGLQFYDGHMLSVEGTGKAGASYGANAGLCLETQYFPDSPNNPLFPDCFLRPGQSYHHITRLRFAEAKIMPQHVA
jgi:aldose 1-epimerase